MSEKPASDVPLPYADRPVATAPGHWVLARAGKRVLRPGGAALTADMLAHAGLAGADVVEMAPGLGRTAAEIVAADPASYTAIDRDPQAAARVAAVVGDRGTVRQGEAAETGLPDAGADVGAATRFTSSASLPMTSTRSTTRSCVATSPAPSTSTPAP